jgi:hypothetical protein
MNKLTLHQSVEEIVISPIISDMNNAVSFSVANTVLPKNGQLLTAKNLTQCTNRSVPFRSNLAADSGKQHSKSQVTCVNIQQVQIITSIK